MMLPFLFLILFTCVTHSFSSVLFFLPLCLAVVLLFVCVCYVFHFIIAELETLVEPFDQLILQYYFSNLFSFRDSTYMCGVALLTVFRMSFILTYVLSVFYCLCTSCGYIYFYLTLSSVISCFLFVWSHVKTMK